MNQLSFMLLATVAASTYGSTSGVNTFHIEEESINREARGSTRHRRHIGSMAGDDFDSINVSTDRQRRLYISDAGVSVDIL